MYEEIYEQRTRAFKPQIGYRIQGYIWRRRQQGDVTFHAKRSASSKHRLSGDISFANSEISPSYAEEKNSILDLRVITPGNVQVDIEIQIEDQKDMMKRSIYYVSKLFSSQIGSGEQYAELGRAIALSFIDFKIFTDERWHHRGRFFDVEDKTEMTDCMELNFVELKKLMHKIDPSDDIGMLWAKFLNAESEEELSMLKTTSNSLGKAVEKVHVVSADSALRYEYDMKEKASRDYHAQMDYKYEQGIEEGVLMTARNFKQLGISTEQISKATGLSASEIEKL